MYRPQYTAEQIREQSPSLPGFDSTGDVFSIFESPFNQIWQPVLSATVVTRMNEKLHVLTGKRSAEGNATHVNVASTPTIRLTYPEAARLLGEKVPFNLGGAINPLSPFVSDSLNPSVTSIPDSTDVLGAKVDHLLALKLGLGPTLERSKQGIGRASLARCIAGFSYLEDTVTGEELYEPLIMFGAIVGLESQYAKEIPAATNSYGNLGWTPIDQYVRGVRSKSVLDVLVSASIDEEIAVCIRGLCNATSVTILNNTSEIERHLTEDGVLPALD